MTSTAFKQLPAEGLPQVPPDIAQCEREFRSTCGPVSLAALFGTTVIEVMRFFPEFPQRDYVTQADMMYALHCCGAQPADDLSTTLPADGVALIQITGPWTQPGTPIRAQLRYTHWIACRSGYIFDQNIGDWLESQEWRTRGAPTWMARIPRYAGFAIRAGIPVTPQKFEFSPFGRIPRRSRS